MTRRVEGLAVCNGAAACRAPAAPDGWQDEGDADPPSQRSNTGGGASSTQRSGPCEYNTQYSQMKQKHLLTKGVRGNCCSRPVSTPASATWVGKRDHGSQGFFFLGFCLVDLGRAVGRVGGCVRTASYVTSHFIANTESCQNTKGGKKKKVFARFKKKNPASSCSDQAQLGIERADPTF